MSHRHTTLLGTFCHAPVCGRVEVLEDALISLDGGGRIDSISLPHQGDYRETRRRAAANGTLHAFEAGQYILPGFIDLHIHAPQYPQLGAALDVPLETWLHKYTFPLEARYADVEFARRAYGTLIDDLAANGTTTAVMFATVHQEATRLLADLAIAKGIRALVGKVAMDDPTGCPD